MMRLCIWHARLCVLGGREVMGGKCGWQARQAGGSGLPGGLFCVPVLVKDNFDTVGMASAAGSAALLDNFAQQDAQQVRPERQR